MRFYHLWVALPASEENTPPESQYIGPDAVQQDGPVRVILGRFGRAASSIRAPEGINYFHVRLKDCASTNGRRGLADLFLKGVW
jgi:redox-sensitive bicupin YhaK (pirin superfamily)